MSKPVQMWDESWYLDKFTQHECCDCGLVHDVKYTVENGRILTNWKVNKRATNKSRKDQGITVKRGDKAPK